MFIMLQQIEIQKKFLHGKSFVYSDNQGIFERHMYESKEELIKKSLIVKNPLYQSGLYRKYTEFVKNNFKTKFD